jgi:class 3 adenylate cyclase
VSVAPNGPKALKNAQGDNTPDLILLDVMMPEMDGYEVCRRLKDDPNTRDIPVIFVTARTELEDETRGFELGAVDYITKPIQPAVVLARVRTHLSLKESRRQLEELSLKLARYLSPQLYRSIFEGKQDARIGSSRKKLTVFMSDIVGFTPQTDSMEAEDLTYLLNSYLNRMAEIVLAHGGTLDKYMGDAVLVFFGDPETKGVSEDAAACVEMALEMRGAMDHLRKEWERRGVCTRFEIRTGITTGYCTVGNFGSEQRMDYTIIGSQVNLANRLQAAAVPGEILIGPETFALVKHGFQCVEKEPIQVKGFEGPVRPYQVVGALTGPTECLQLAESRQGFSLSLDPAATDPAEREAIVQALRAAISTLL